MCICASPSRITAEFAIHHGLRTLTAESEMSSESFEEIVCEMHKEDGKGRTCENTG